MQRIGAGRYALPGGCIAFGQSPSARAAGEHQLVVLDPPGGRREAGNGGSTARLDDDLIACPARRGVRQRQLAEWFLELLQQGPVPKELIRGNRCGADGGLGAHEEKSLAL